MELPKIDMPKVGELLEGLFEKLIDWLEAFVVMIPNLFVAFFVVLLAWVASRWIGSGIERVLFRTTRNRPISGLIGSVVRIGTIVVGVFVALGLLNLEKTVTSLIAGVGVVGLALGFAFQDIAANLMSGFMMALNRPFRVNDQVEVSGRLGRIKSVELRATRIETLDGLSLLVPNKEIFQNTIINYTRTTSRRLEISVGTAYCDDMGEVERVLREAVGDLEQRDKSREIEVLFEEFGGSSINCNVLVWLSQSDQMSYRKARSEGMKAIKRALDKAKISIPFPIRTLDFGANVVGGVSLDLGIAEGRQGKEI